MNHHQATKKRIIAIDALRGLALFGILVVNIFVFNAPYAHYGEYYMTFTGMEAVLLESMIFFFVGKFMFIFAFLFGYGCWLQYEKYENHNAFSRFWMRRMFLLALFGVFHILFFSFGDILLPYALLGMLLPLVIRWKNWQLVVLALLIYAIPIYEFVLRQWIGYDSFFMQSEYTLETYRSIYLDGSIWERFSLRMYDYWSFRNEKLIMYIPKEFGLFLAGIIGGRTKMAEYLALRKGIVFCVLAFIASGLWYFYRADIRAFLMSDSILWQQAVFAIIAIFYEAIHGFFYITTFWLLWRINFFTKIASGLKYVGKMSLTNYILQSIICTTIFSGFGLYASLSPSQLLILALGIFIVQSIASCWWLRYHQFGPLEWIWRKYSYRNLKPTGL